MGIIISPPESNGYSPNVNVNNTSSVITSNATGITVSILPNTAPFNARTQAVRAEVCHGTKVKDLPTDMATDKTGRNWDKFPKGVESSPALSSLLTSTNPYYVAKGGSKPGYVGCNTRVTNDSQWNSDMANKFGSYGRWLHNTLPGKCVLPNCVGGARGRYQELIPLLGTNESFPNNYPRAYRKSVAQFKDHEVKKTNPGGDYVQAGPNFWIWCDKAGKYGVKNGLWGWGEAKDGWPPLPGAMVTWHWYEGAKEHQHIEFIDAVYNFGREDCYFYSTASASGNYNGYILRTGKRTKNRTFGKNNNLYGYGGEYYDTEFLYTPLCNFNNVSTGIFGNITLDYTASAEEQIEQYNQILDYLSNSKENIIVGSKVKITYLGNQKPNGIGKSVNRIGGEGWIKKIYDAGMPFQYEVVDSKKLTIGYFNKDSLEAI